MAFSSGDALTGGEVIIMSDSLTSSGLPVVPASNTSCSRRKCSLALTLTALRMRQRFKVHPPCSTAPAEGHSGRRILSTLVLTVSLLLYFAHAAGFSTPPSPPSLHRFTRIVILQLQPSATTTSVSTASGDVQHLAADRYHSIQPFKRQRLFDG